jgi:predicted O-methyltransferase YrrM
MKSYKEYARQSVSMSQDELFKETLHKLFSENTIDYVIETGTWLGTGSTRTLSEAMSAGHRPKAYYTIESNLTFHSLARLNLLRWGFVKPIWGDTVDKKEALSFLKNDDVLKNHQKYPDVFIDTLEDPVQFYINELEGRLGKNPIINTVDWFSRMFLHKPQDVLRQLVNQYRDTKPLILLDSAGGIGWLEYQTVRDTLGSRPYWLILDDIHHLKHFRSFRDVQLDPSFDIIAYSLADGWMIAEHKGK